MSFSGADEATKLARWSHRNAPDLVCFNLGPGALLEVLRTMLQKFDEIIREQQKVRVRTNPITGAHVALLRETLAPYRGSGAWLLDAGCGYGDYLNVFHEIGLHVVGADISMPVLTYARKTCPRAALEIVDFQSKVGGLPHRDASYDVIFCGEMLPQMRDVHLVLSEFNRILRERGLLIITTPFNGRIKDALLVLFAFERHFYPHNYLLRFFTPTSLAASLRRAGFQPESWRGVGRSWPFWKTIYMVSHKGGPSGPPPNPLNPNG